MCVWEGVLGVCMRVWPLRVRGVSYGLGEIQIL